MDGNDERDKSTGEGSPQGAEQKVPEKAIRDARGGIPSWPRPASERISVQARARAEIPRARKRSPSRLTPDVKAMLETALNQKIRVKEGEREKIMSRLAIGFEQLAIQFAKGDRYARRDVFELADPVRH